MRSLWEIPLPALEHGLKEVLKEDSLEVILKGDSRKGILKEESLKGFLKEHSLKRFPKEDKSYAIGSIPLVDSKKLPKYFWRFTEGIDLLLEAIR